MRPIVRTITGATLVATILVSVLLFAWATHHPDDPRIAAARDWPLIGRLAAWIADTYLPAGRAADDDDAPAPAPGVVVERVAPARPVDARPWVWVQPGMPLRREPSADSEVIATFDVYTNLPQLEVREGWERVRWHGHDGWLPPPPDQGPRLGRDPDPPGPLLSRPADPERLAIARDLLGAGAVERMLGPYTLLTDTSNTPLIERLARLAPTLDQVYAERFARRPLGTPRETVVLFEREEAYRQLQAASGSIAGIDAAGHAGWGLAALYRGEREMDDVAATFVHEITHLMNRRAIGPALPPWLDEGLAEAFASSRIQPWGAIEPRAWGGARRQLGRRYVFTPTLAARLRVAEAIRRGTLASLEQLLALDADAFLHDRGGPDTRYAASGLFVRYLLDGEDGRFAPAFRAFLDAVTGGGSVAGEALRQHLGTTWDDLDRRFRAWVLTAVEA